MPEPSLGFLSQDPRHWETGGGTGCSEATAKGSGRGLLKSSTSVLKEASHVGTWRQGTAERGREGARENLVFRGQRDQAQGTGGGREGLR